MQTAILDTNFILTCVRQKIDFFRILEETGFRIIIPAQVVQELKKISSRGGFETAKNSELALKILEKNNFEKIILKKKDVDKGIIKFAKKNPETAIATLDREIKRKTKNRKIAIRGKKKLEIA